MLRALLRITLIRQAGYHEMFYVIMRVSLEWTAERPANVFLSVTEQKNHPPFVNSDKTYHLIRLDHILDHVNSCVSTATIDLHHQPGVSAVALLSKRAAVRPIRDSSITHCRTAGDVGPHGSADSCFLLLLFTSA